MRLHHVLLVARGVKPELGSPYIVTTTRLLVFLSVVLTLVGSIHFYFWVRLVKNTQVPVPYRAWVGASLVALALSLPLAFELRAKHGVYFVTGNHEYYSGVDPWIAELTRLRNASAAQRTGRGGRSWCSNCYSGCG